MKCRTITPRFIARCSLNYSMSKKRNNLSRQTAGTVHKTAPAPASCAACENAANGRPSWKFEFISNDGPFCFPSEPQKLHGIISSLRNFETKTLVEWQVGPGNMYTAYELGSCKDKIDDRVLAVLNKFYPDEDAIHRFRTGTSERIYALKRPGCVFALTWWDPDHEIYKCGN